MPTLTIDQKALTYLAEGRVRAERVDATTRTATFRVFGSSPAPYTVEFTLGHWSCDCPARVAACAHITACSLVSAPLSPSTLQRRSVRRRPARRVCPA